MMYGPTTFNGAEVAATDLELQLHFVLAGLVANGIHKSLI